MPQRSHITLATGESVTAIEYPAAASSPAGVTLILAHGAGAGQSSGFMVDFAEGLAERGVSVVTFNFPYMERGRRLPDRNVVLEACWRAVIESRRGTIISRSEKLALGGKSMGGRIASQVAAAGASELAGLVFLGYPLHPPGRPDRLRAAHLADVKAPMLFVQGSRDPFGAPEELRSIIARLSAPADLHIVEGGDHSFKVRKSAGVAQQHVYRTVQDRIATWLRAIAGS